MTDLAYQACSRLLRLRQALAREQQEPCLVNTVPDDNSMLPVNPLAEVQVILQQLLFQHEHLSTSRLRKTVQHLQALLRQARDVIDSLGGPPHPARWHEALAGIRNAADAADALGLASLSLSFLPFARAVVGICLSLSLSLSLRPKVQSPVLLLPVTPITRKERHTFHALSSTCTVLQASLGENPLESFHLYIYICVLHIYIHSTVWFLQFQIQRSPCMS